MARRLAKRGSRRILGADGGPAWFDLRLAKLANPEPLHGSLLCIARYRGGSV